MRDKAVALFGVLLLLALMAGGVWVWTSAPCGLWTFSKAGEVPARCLMR